MSATNINGQLFGCDNCGCTSAHILPCSQPSRCTGVQSFDLDAEFRRRFKLCDDDEEEDDCDYAVSPEYSEYSDDYMSMTGSGASTTTLPAALLVDRLATLSVSSGDSFCLYDPEDDEDRCSISTLENVDNIDENIMETQLPPSATSSGAEEDREFNLLARSATTTVCRSASLKSTYGSKPSCSPRTKKVVRFADALGLDLESIRHILDFSDAPTTSLGLPTSDFGHLDHGRPTAASAKVSARMKLMVRFSEPGSSINFLRRVQERKISLEEVSVDGERLTVSGVIRVANVAYQKQVCFTDVIIIIIRAYHYHIVVVVATATAAAVVALVTRKPS